MYVSDNAKVMQRLNSMRQIALYWFAAVRGRNQTAMAQWMAQNVCLVTNRLNDQLFENRHEVVSALIRESVGWRANSALILNLGVEDDAATITFKVQVMHNRQIETQLRQVKIYIKKSRIDFVLFGPGQPLKNSNPLLLSNHLFSYAKGYS